MATSCGRLRTTSYRYALEPCPDTAFALPPEARLGHDYVTSKVPRQYRPPKGADYLTYALMDTIAPTTDRAVFVAVRLSRPDPCTLEIASTNYVADANHTHVTDVLAGHRAERVVRALLSGGPTRAQFPAFRTDTFRTLKDWTRAQYAGSSP